MGIRLLREADLPVIRAWMREAPGAPLWSDVDLAGLAGEPRPSRKISAESAGRHG